MTTKVEKTIAVSVPVRTAYDQWTQFEEFPQFLGGVREVRQLDDRRLHWVAEIAGVRREWEAEIIEQVPDQKVAWAATDGATNAGAVFFSPIDDSQTLVRLHLEYEPEGLVEQAGDKLGIVGRQAEGDLERFKKYIESRGTASGGWRGEVEGDVGTPVAEASAEETRGDSGKAGVSGTAVAAGVAAAAVAGVAAAAVAKKGSADADADAEADTGVDALPAAPVTEAGQAAVPVTPAAADLPASTPAPYADTTDPGRPLD